MLHKMSGLGGRKVSPPMPTCMSSEQKSNYLSDLRNNRPARPTGSRPAPFKSTNHGSLEGPSPPSHSDAESAIPSGADVTLEDSPNTNKRDRTSGISKSVSFSPSVGMKGRPLAYAPHANVPGVKGRKVSPTATVQRSALPRDALPAESANRLLEKEEAHTLREALQIIDQRDEEKRIHEAAQYEAADLVWKHRNPKAAEDEKAAPYRNPDTENRKSYGTELPAKYKNSSRSVSDSSNSSQGSRSASEGHVSRRRSRVKDQRLSDALQDLQLASQERAADILATTRSSRRRSSGNRQVSSGSAKGIFRNPDDQIYEEPEDAGAGAPINTEVELPLKSRARNSLPRGSRPLPDKPGTVPAATRAKIDRFEIHRNPPSQSRNAAYTANTSTPIPKIEVIEDVDTPNSASALEIRGEDIRAATSMKRKDRSPKLPTPSAVSDTVGRPIVSFDPSWRPRDDSPRNSYDLERPVIKLTESPRASKELDRPLPRPVPSQTEMVASAPVVPTINLPDEDAGLPTIQVEEDATPSISVSKPPVPMINAPAVAKDPPRPLPHHSASTPSKMPSAKTARVPWLQSGVRGIPTVSCSSCSFPIAGRVVTACGSSTLSLKARLHPECFTCHHCSTPLECVSFYPEPDNKRAERLDAEGIPLDSAEADLRFYCHLDFHEFFSPRCRSCKTPIEGEVIVAAGAEWHVGHFFCGECGDPFDSNTPFVEKDGYAYCVSCHTKRTSARCKECKKQILDELTVEALGGKWHEECFVCYECGDGFGDDGRFFVRDVEVEPTDKERRRGISQKTEERAVCAGCEERRLKA